MNEKIKSCFENYKESIFRINHDLIFWNNYLESQNKALIEDNINNKESLSAAIFCAYDWSHDKIGGNLKCNEKVYNIKISDLETKRVEFFSWIINLSILKAYNSIEILILQGIQLSYFPDSENPTYGKKQNKKIQGKIKSILIENEIRFNEVNNDHIMKFLEFKSAKIKSFLNLNLNINIKTKWYEFFVLISLLRNIIAHNGMIISLDTKNEIKSKANDIFSKHFELLPYEDNYILSPKQAKFDEFINLINSFAVNILKFMLEKDDLEFIDLK